MSIVPSLSGRQRTLSLAAVLSSTFFLGFSHGIGYPLTSMTFEGWGAPAWVTGLAAGMPALATMLLLPIAPTLAQRFGFVPTMIAGLSLGIAGFALLPVFPFIEAWMVLRFLIGAGLTLPWLLGETWMNAVSTDQNRGRVLALYVAAMFGGYGSGPIVLGLMPQGMTGAVVIACAALALTCLPLVLAYRLAPAFDQHASGGLLAMFRRCPTAIVTGLLAGVIEYGYIGLLPVVGLREGLDKTTSLQLVSAFLWGGVTLSFFFGWLSDRLSRNIVLGVSLIAFMGLALVGSVTLHDPSVALATTFVLGGVASNLYVLGLAILGDRIAGRDLAQANAAFLMLYQVGTLAGPPVAGAALDRASTLGFAGSIVGFAFVVGLWMWNVERRAARRASNTDPSAAISPTPCLDA